MANDNNCLISRRYLLGPYEEPLFVLVEPSEGEQADSRSCSVRFLADNQETRARLDRAETTVYRLPPRQTCVVRLNEVKGSGYVFEIEQLPAKLIAAKPGPFPPIGECVCECPPYTLSCGPNEVADCSTGQLRCIPR